MDIGDSAKMQSGLNLTYPTILCDVKYIRAAGEERGEQIPRDLVKKAGYFQSEKNIFEKIYIDMGMYPERVRYPLVYIMEAADDIAYGLSDIADGIEKKIISLDFFVNKFSELWKQNGYDNLEMVIDDKIYDVIRDNENNIHKDFNNSLGSQWKKWMIDDAVEEYVKNIEQ